MKAFQLLDNLFLRKVKQILKQDTKSKNSIRKRRYSIQLNKIIRIDLLKKLINFFTIGRGVAEGSNIDGK